MNVIPTRGAARSRRSDAATPAATSSAAPPQLDTEAISVALLMMCEDAFAYGSDARTAAMRARHTVLEAVRSGATSASVDLPVSVARRLAGLGFTCHPSSEQRPACQGPQEDTVGLIPADALATSRHVLRQPPLQAPVENDLQPQRTTEPRTVPELAAALAEGLLSWPTGAVTLKDLKGLGRIPQQIADVVAARTPEGTPWLYLALQDGRAFEVAAYMDALRELDLGSHLNAGIVTARNPAGAPGLLTAMRHGREAAVTAFMDGLIGLDLSPQQVADIVTAKGTDGRNALCVAQHKGHTGAAKAFMDGLARLQQQQRITAQQIADIVAAVVPPIRAAHQTDADSPQLLAASRDVPQEPPQPQRARKPKQLEQPQKLHKAHKAQKAQKLQKPQQPAQETQKPEKPQQTPQSVRTSPQWSPVSFASTAFLAFCGIALFGGVVRQLMDSGLQVMDSGPQFEPAVDSPTPVTFHLPSFTTDEMAPPGTASLSGNVSFVADQCPADDNDGPDLADTLAATLATSRHVLREGRPPQSSGADSTPVRTRLEVTPAHVGDLLAGMGFDGKPGLHFMARNGQAAELADFMERLKGLDLDPQQAADIVANNASGITALYIALLEGHAAVVAALMGGLNGLGLSPQRTLGIVMAKDLNGIAALYFALQRGHDVAVTAYMGSLRDLKLSPDQNCEAVTPRDPYGCTGLYLALAEGQADSVAAFMGGLKYLDLSSAQIAGILMAKDTAGIGGLYFALQKGDAATVAAFMAGLHNLGLAHEQIVELVTAINPLGFPGLHVALQHGYTEAVTAFLNGLCGLGLRSEDITQIAAAKGPGIGNALSIARAESRWATVKAYMDGLTRLQELDLITGEQVESIVSGALL